MDELSAFLNAPPELLEREAHLLKFADVVFTGGPSLYRAKKDRHPNVHCFPEQRGRQTTSRAARGRHGRARRSGAACASPRLGFFGVIDERMDLDCSMLGGTATRNGRS